MSQNTTRSINSENPETDSNFKEKTSPEKELNSMKKHRKVAEITYLNNKESDYTEKIEALDNQFNYEHDRNHYWGPPELSIFYGTPLYEQASHTQKLALNHLYWATQYNQTAATEANAILYNQVTEGVFSTIGGFDVLCQELSLETAQEHHHIHAFHSVGYQIKKSLFGVKTLKVSRYKTKGTSKNILSNHNSTDLSPFLESFSSNLEKTFLIINNQLLQNSQSKIYSDYLKKLEEEGELLPMQTTGLLGQVVPTSLSRCMTLSFGTSPFLACFFFVTRYLANILLKNYEYRYYQHYRKLAQAEEFIPIPTALSYYHLLDESFHTTTSQLIAQELYKEFTKPTLYERFLANVILYRGQNILLSGLSGVMPASFRNDDVFMLSFYQILRSPIFEMSDQDALYWLEKCLCHDHEGFHLNLKYHRHLLTDIRRAFEPLNYLWSVNRQLGVMASSNSINKTIRKNRESFVQFSKIINNNSIRD